MSALIYKRGRANNEDATDEKSEEKRDVSLLGVLVFLRIVNVFLVRTSFVPDEYWQSLEVAHNAAFGYGFLTWEWTQGIRSYGYPGVIATAYQALKIMNFDTVSTIIYTPRIVQGFLSAVSDWYLYRFVKRHFGEEIAKFALVAHLSSWFWWYCATRTIVNTLETCTLCVGMHYYPWQANDAPRREWIKYQIISIATCMIRPTAAVVWVPLALWHLARSRKDSTFISYFAIVFIFAFICTFIDCVHYGKLIFVHWNFFTFNVVKNMGGFYGTHPWHWYVTQGVPVVLGSQLLFFLHSLFTISRRSTIHRFRICKCLLGLMVLTVTIYSFLGHKEFRFVLHLIPMASIFCAINIANFSKKWQKYAVQFLLISNAPIALYTGLVHQRGSLAIISDLRESLVHDCNPQCSGSVLYLMPCHTTPLYSHLHVNVSTRFLQCTPNLNGEEDYEDEADRFYKNPTDWLDLNIFSTKNMKDGTPKPRWILLFDTLYKRLENYGPLYDFEIRSTVFHTHFPEGKVGKYIHLLRRKPLHKVSP